MEKIVLVASIGLELHVANKNNVCEVVNNIETKNVINIQFEPEPFVLHNYRKEYFEPKIKDFPRNKFIDKPKFNFRKR